MVSPNATASRSQTLLKKDAIGVLGILFFVLSAQAPLTCVVGIGAIAITLGNGPAFPSAYLIVGVVMLVFSVGFTAMTRHVSNHGGFSALIEAGLGRRAGAVAAWLAVLSYSVVQASLYGLLGVTVSSLIDQYTGVHVPWWLIALVAVAGILVLGESNIEFGARILSILVTAEFLILFAFALVVIFGGRTAEGIDLGASFSPSAIAAGAPGIAFMFAIAAMFGFESTTIYSAEARDRKRTVPRATYTAVIIMAVFLALSLWALVLYYGPSHVESVAAAAMQGDAAAFVTAPLSAVLGPWAGITASVLLCTSLIAALLAFHNVINRYLHAMAGRGFLPSALQRTNRHHAPAIAARVQTALSILSVAPFAVFGLPPLTTLFDWFQGLGIAALVTLYVLTSIAVIVFFRRTKHDTRLWHTLIAPAIAVVMMVAQLALIVANFPMLSGGDTLTSAILLAILPVVVVIGWLVAGRAPQPAAAGSTAAHPPTAELQAVSAP